MCLARLGGVFSLDFNKGILEGLSVDELEPVDPVEDRLRLRPTRAGGWTGTTSLERRLLVTRIVGNDVLGFGLDGCGGNLCWDGRDSGVAVHVSSFLVGVLKEGTMAA